MLQKIKKALALSFVLFIGTQTAIAAEVAMGTFYTVTHPDEVSGSVSIKKDSSGQLHIVLGKDFKTAEGPDLFVVLHKELTPGSYTSENSIVVAALKKFSGKQVYTLPAGTNINDYRSVVIWCKKFDVTFGAAALK